MVSQTIRPPQLNVPAERVVTADVRDELRAGGEPFGTIMSALASLPPGGVLCVRAIFEPVPLYAVMKKKRGLEHWTEQRGADDWLVWFYSAETPAVTAPATTARDTHDAPAVAGADDVVVLDVRGLEPPEPMVRTLAALEELPEGATLLQLNVRVPKFLLPLLEERGYTWSVKEQEDGPVRVFIRRREEETTMSQEKTLDVRVIAPRDKHPMIFQWFGALAVGDWFELVNDHDPKPLRYQFEFEHRDQYGWEYLEEGPEVWRVRISKTAEPVGESHPSAEGRAPNLVACKVGRR